MSGDGAGAAGDAGELWVTGVGLVTPLGIGVVKTKAPLAATVRLLARLSWSTTDSAATRPLSVPPIV